MEVHQNLNPNPKNGYATSDLKMAMPTSDIIMETPAPVEVVAKKRRLSGDLNALGVIKNQARYEQAALGGGSGMSCLLTGGEASIETHKPTHQSRIATSLVAWARGTRMRSLRQLLERQENPYGRRR